MTDHVLLRGVMKGHSGWVTTIATTPESPDTLLTGSRDKSVLIWSLSRDDPINYGFARKSLTGHSGYVQDVVISSDGQFALSGSWDGELRLWDLAFGATTRRFVGHQKDVLSVAFSADNRQIVSGSRDRTIRLWNTLGECKYSIEENNHTEWISCVRFSPSAKSPVIVSGGWDKLVKVWNLSTCTLKANLIGHKGYVNSVCVSPDGSLCASGGRDGVAMLWDLKESRNLYSLSAGSIIHALVFSPNRYWLCAATDAGIKIYDLESKAVVADLTKEMEGFGIDAKRPNPACLSLAWSADGSTLFAGYDDCVVRVFEVR